MNEMERDGRHFGALIEGNAHDDNKSPPPNRRECEIHTHMHKVLKMKDLHEEHKKYHAVKRDMNSIDVTAANFDAIVLQAELPVLLHVCTSWSDKCRLYSELMREIGKMKHLAIFTSHEYYIVPEEMEETPSAPEEMEETPSNDSTYRPNAVPHLQMSLQTAFFDITRENFPVEAARARGIDFIDNGRQMEPKIYMIFPNSSAINTQEYPHVSRSERIYDLFLWTLLRLGEYEPDKIRGLMHLSFSSQLQGVSASTLYEAVMAAEYEFNATRFANFGSTSRQFKGFLSMNPKSSKYNTYLKRISDVMREDHVLGRENVPREWHIPN